jgi:hypothetical protein
VITEHWSGDEATLGVLLRRCRMQLWQMDLMGWLVLEDGPELKIVTGVDWGSLCGGRARERRATSSSLEAVGHRNSDRARD